MRVVGSSKREERLLVLFDVCSASVGACIAASSPEGMSVVWSTRVEYGFRSDTDFERYSRTMYATLLEVGMRVSGEGFKEVRTKVPKFRVKNVEVHCVLSPPWFFGAVETGVLKKERPFQTTTDVVQELMKENVSRVIDTSERFLLWDEVMGGDGIVLEHVPVEVRLEGYPVQNYSHRHVKEISVRSYVSLMSESVRGHIEEVLEKVFPNFPCTLYSSTNVFATRRFGISEKLFTVELTGEMTTVSYIVHGLLKGTVTVPIGFNHLLRELSPNAINTKEARAPLEVLLHGEKNTPTDFESLPEELKEPLSTWQRRVTEGLFHILDGVSAPRIADLITDSFWYPVFSVAMRLPIPASGKDDMLHLELLDTLLPKHKKVTKNSHADFRLSTLPNLIVCCTDKKSV